jgi:hypothetical protein
MSECMCLYGAHVQEHQTRTIRSNVTFYDDASWEFVYIYSVLIVTIGPVAGSYSYC